MPDPISRSGAGVDLSPRVVSTVTVVGSPAAAAETTVASLTITNDLVVGLGVFLFAYCSFTVGTNGVSGVLKIHHTNAAGATVGTSGAVTLVAANLASISVLGQDLVPALPNQIYIATLQIASGSATSTVAAVQLTAVVV